MFCCAPSSFGQSALLSRTSSGLAGSAPWVSAIPRKLILQPASLGLISEPLYDHKKKKKGGGGDDWGGTSLPEGGSPFIYAGLAGIVCFGAVFFDHRRRKNACRSTGS